MTASTSPESPNARPDAIIRLSLDKVDRINRWRAQYIAVYFVWMCLNAYLMIRAANPDSSPPSVALMLSVNTLLILFYLRFVPVLRMMGYVFWTYIPACLLAILPIPGVLVVAYLDRTLVKTLRKGLDGREALLRHIEPNPTRDAAAETRRDV